MLSFIDMQRRNLRIVYDAIGTLADAVGGELNQVVLISNICSCFCLMSIFVYQ
jgi:hypothetical protein